MDETWWNLVWWYQRGLLHEISWCRLSPTLSSDFNSLKHCILEGEVPHSSWYMIDYYSMFLRTPDLEVFLSANSILQENHEETVNQHQEVNQFEDCGWVVPDFPDYLDCFCLETLPSCCHLNTEFGNKPKKFELKNLLETFWMGGNSSPIVGNLREILQAQGHPPTGPFHALARWGPGHWSQSWQ